MPLNSIFLIPIYHIYVNIHFSPSDSSYTSNTTSYKNAYAFFPCFSALSLLYFPKRSEFRSISHHHNCIYKHKSNANVHVQRTHIVCCLLHRQIQTHLDNNTSERCISLYISLSRSIVSAKFPVVCRMFIYV